LGKLTSRAQKVGIIDAERVIPGWKANGNPFVIHEHLSRGEFASEIVDRLDTSIAIIDSSIIHHLFPPKIAKRIGRDAIEIILDFAEYHATTGGIYKSKGKS
jgi:hypothetical protein